MRHWWIASTTSTLLGVSIRLTAGRRRHSRLAPASDVSLSLSSVRHYSPIRWASVVDVNLSLKQPFESGEPVDNWSRRNLTLKGSTFERLSRLNDRSKSNSNDSIDWSSSYIHIDLTYAADDELTVDPSAWSGTGHLHVVRVPRDWRVRQIAWRRRKI